MPFPSVVVGHAYGYDGFLEHHVNLGVLTRAVCESILHRHHRYDFIVLPGGWHQNGLPARPTSAELMARFLAERDVPPSKIITQFTHAGTAHYEPAQDTIMEADLTGHIFRELFPDMPPQEVPFDAFGAFFHIPRIAAIWRHRGANLQDAISAFSVEMLFPSMWGRIAQEPPGYALTCLDPLGEGRFFRRLRRGRIHTGADQFMPLVSDAWFPTLAFAKTLFPADQS